MWATMNDPRPMQDAGGIVATPLGRELISAHDNIIQVDAVEADICSSRRGSRYRNAPEIFPGRPVLIRLSILMPPLWVARQRCARVAYPSLAVAARCVCHPPSVSRCAPACCLPGDTRR